MHIKPEFQCVPFFLRFFLCINLSSSRRLYFGRGEINSIFVGDQPTN